MVLVIQINYLNTVYYNGINWTIDLIRSFEGVLDTNIIWENYRVILILLFYLKYSEVLNNKET